MNIFKILKINCTAQIAVSGESVKSFVYVFLFIEGISPQIQ